MAIFTGEGRVAAEQGEASNAVVKNHFEVLAVLKRGNAVYGIRGRDLITGEEQEIHGKIIFNATGPWSPRLAAMAGCEVKLRPGKGIHLIFDRRLTNMAIVARAIDGRQIFINPHENTTMVGTTDDDYYGDLDDISVTEDEIEYLLQGIESVFPQIREARIISTWRGVRPTLYGEHAYEDELSRSHRLFDHETIEGVKGFVSMAGGKLASYREMAEEATDLVCQKLAVNTPCQTHVLPLPGGDATPDPHKLAKEFGLYPYVVARLIFRHGSRARRILEMIRAHPDDGEVVCACEPVLAAELRYCIRHEWAVTLSDLMRRTRLGTGACQGGCCAMRAAILLGQERNLQPAEVMAELKGFLNELWRARSPVIDGAQMAEEEMIRGIFAGNLQLGLAPL